METTLENIIYLGWILNLGGFVFVAFVFIYLRIMYADYMKELIKLIPEEKILLVRVLYWVIPYAIFIKNIAVLLIIISNRTIESKAKTIWRLSNMFFK